MGWPPSHHRLAASQPSVGHPGPRGDLVFPVELATPPMKSRAARKPFIVAKATLFVFHPATAVARIVSTGLSLRGVQVNSGWRAFRLVPALRQEARRTWQQGQDENNRTQNERHHGRDRLVKEVEVVWLAGEKGSNPLEPDHRTDTAENQA